MVNEGLQTATGYFHSIPLDVIILVVCSIALTFCAYQFGKKTALALMLALYPGFTLFLAFPFVWTNTSNTQAAYTGAGIFLVFWIAAFFLTRPFFVSSYPTRHLTQFIEAFALGVVTTGTAVAVGYHVKIFPALYAFAPATAKIFDGNIAFFAWALVPLIGILLFIRA